MTRYVGAILAAGRGSRMGERVRRVPKPLMPVGDAPLIVHQIRAMQAVGIDHVFVVVATGGEATLRAALEPHASGVEVTCVEQGQPLGSANAVGRLASYIDDPFVMLLGDYYVEGSDEVIARMVDAAERVEGSATLAKDESNPRLLREACCIELDAQQRMLRIVEKPVRPAGGLKGCGYYVLRPEFFDAIRRTPRTALRDEYELTHALDLFVQAGHPVSVIETEAHDMNFTRPADVLRCNLEWLARQGLGSYVAPGVVLPSQVRIERCVIGSGADLRDVEELRDVVVFPGAECHGVPHLRRALLLGGDIVSVDAEPGVVGPERSAAG